MSKSSRVWALALAALLIVSAARAEDAKEDVQDESDEYDEVAKAHVLAHKYVKITDESLAYPMVVQGRNVTVNVVLQNNGAATAYDVIFSDVLPPNAQLVEGSLNFVVPKLAVGSQQTFSYVIVFTSGGSMEVAFLPQGVVSYKSGDAEGPESTGQSTKSGIVVLTPVQQIQRYALIVGTYASLGICRTTAQWRNMAIFLLIVAVVLGGNWGAKQFKTSKTTSRRKKALQELEKEE